MARYWIHFLTLTSVLVGAVEAHAMIFGTLEAPSGTASQVSNVQGWAYTTTPGASLIQPFQVRIDGVDAFVVPCCSDRGDVKDAHPEAPLASGFAGVYNWALEGGGGASVLVEVVIRDTAGGELIVSKTVDVYTLSTTYTFLSNLFPDAKSVGFQPLHEGWCELGRKSVSGVGHAELKCRNFIANKVLPPPEDFDARPCPSVSFLWARGSQGFVQTSDCEDIDRWVDHGDGTATDNWSGLVWELKTDDDSIHDVDETYTRSPGDPWKEEGTAYTALLGLLNMNSSSDGTSPSGCFADRCDWRLPTSEELRAISPDHFVCDILDCSVIPGETAESTYLSSTTGSALPTGWTVDFSDGDLVSGLKFVPHRARAVSGGR